MTVVAFFKLQIMASRILCVDDDHDITEFLTIVLSGEGYEVFSANSPSNIFDLIQLYKPHLILLDVYMGPYNGMEICKAMRSYIRTEETPVLIISSDESIEAAIEDFGATDIILKPFNTKILIEKVNSYLSPKISG